MLVYAGGVAGKALEKVRAYGMGRLVTPDQWKSPESAPGIRWCLDNGAYSAHTNKQPFPADAFLECVNEKVWHPYGWTHPDFVVCPDIVMGGRESLNFSMNWREDVWTTDVWFYLAVQDEMTEQDVAYAWDWAAEEGFPFRGIFVGGGLEWKYRTSPDWVRFAHERNGFCHIGRISSVQRIMWATRIGADSVDSSAFGRFNMFHRVQDAREQRRLDTFRLQQTVLA